MDNSDNIQALIVRNIGDIESALKHAEDISDDLWEAVASTVRNRFQNTNWYVSEFDVKAHTIWFAPRDWLFARFGGRSVLYDRGIRRT